MAARSSSFFASRPPTSRKARSEAISSVSRRRLATVARTDIAASGLERTSATKSLRSSATTLVSVRADALAERGRPSSSERSPKKFPGPKTASVRSAPCELGT